MRPDWKQYREPNFEMGAYRIGLAALFISPGGRNRALPDEAFWPVENHNGSREPTNEIVRTARRDTPIRTLPASPVRNSLAIHRPGVTGGNSRGVLPQLLCKLAQSAASGIVIPEASRRIAVAVPTRAIALRVSSSDARLSRVEPNHGHETG